MPYFYKQNCPLEPSLPLRSALEFRYTEIAGKLTCTLGRRYSKRNISHQEFHYIEAPYAEVQL